jgi:hypothetical protein
VSIRQQILNSLNNGEYVEASLPATIEEHIAWVSIQRLFSSRYPDSPKLGHLVKANAQFVIHWIEMSEQHYKAFLSGSDVGVNTEATKLELEFANDDSELEGLLLRRLKDLNALISRSKNPTRYP